MNRATRKRDRKLKTIKPGIDETAWGAFKKFLLWCVIGAALWGILSYVVIGLINYRMGG